METSYIRTMSNFPILVITPLIFQIPWAPAPFPKRGVRALHYHRGPQISAHKEDGVSFSLLFLCASRKTHRQTVSASEVNLLRQKRKKRTLAETLQSYLEAGERYSIVIMSDVLTCSCKIQTSRSVLTQCGRQCMLLFCCLLI